MAFLGVSGAAASLGFLVAVFFFVVFAGVLGSSASPSASP